MRAVVIGLAVTIAVMSPAGARAQSPSVRDTTGADTLARARSAVAQPGTPETSLQARNSITDWSRERRPPKHAFPFARISAPTTYPELSLSIGFGDFHSGFPGVMKAFRAIEDTLRAGGYSVPEAQDVNDEGVFHIDFDARLHPHLDAGLQFAQTNGLNELRFVGALLSGRYTLSQAEGVSLLAGLGGGVYHFRIDRKYGGTPITPLDPYGGYTQLDIIRLEGGGDYWTVDGRVEVRTSPSTALVGGVQYFGTGDVSTSAGKAGRISVNASGTTSSLSLRVSFL